MIKDILLFVWQLPQNLLGLLLRFIYDGYDTDHVTHIVRRSTKMRGGISLGRYVIINQWAEETTALHEYGHCRQSMLLGWLYLPIIGLPSIIWAGMHQLECISKRWSYYSFFTERWADRLGGLEVR